MKQTKSYGSQIVFGFVVIFFISCVVLYKLKTLYYKLTKNKPRAVYCTPTEQELSRSQIVVQYRLICPDQLGRRSEIYYKSKFRTRCNQRYQRFSRVVPYTQWDYNNFEKITPFLKQKLNQVFSFNKTIYDLNTFQVSTTREAIKQDSSYVYTVVLITKNYPRGLRNTKWRTDYRHLLQFQTVNPRYSTDDSKCLILIPLTQVLTYQPVYLNLGPKNSLFLYD